MAEGKSVESEEWRKKMNKIRFFRELEQMKLQKHTVERERIGFMYEKHGREYSHLEDVEKALNDELRIERLKLEQQLKKMKLKVTEFQKELKHAKPTPEFVQKLKTTMEDIESTIGDFKQKQRDIFENLMLAEKETEQEITILEGKINAVKDLSGPISARQSKTGTKSFQNDFPKEVQEFEAFVSRHGGMQGGWDDYDHGAFLRIRDKNVGSQGFIKAAARQIPGRSEEDIEKHEKWYAHFIELKTRKKEVIAAWRKIKEEKEILDINTSAEDEGVKKQREKSEELMRKKMEEEREAKKEDLRAWKAQKLKERREAEERRLQEETRKRTLDERRRKEKEAEMKVVHEKLREIQEQKERLRWMKELDDEQLDTERRQEVQEKISQFQTRDRVALSIKQKVQQRRQEEEIVKKEKLERIKEKVVVLRDPTRLYRPTQGWVNRTRDQSVERSQGNTIASMPHRAIPAWRQNL